MSDERSPISPLAKQLAKMFKEQTETELRTHPGLSFVRHDYFALPSEARTKLKEDAACAKKAWEGRKRCKTHHGNLSSELCG